MTKEETKAYYRNDYKALISLMVQNNPEDIALKMQENRIVSGSDPESLYATIISLIERGEKAKVSAILAVPYKTGVYDAQTDEWVAELMREGESRSNGRSMFGKGAGDESSCNDRGLYWINNECIDPNQPEGTGTGTGSGSGTGTGFGSDLTAGSLLGVFNKIIDHWFPSRQPSDSKKKEETSTTTYVIIAVVVLAIIGIVWWAMKPGKKAA